MTDIVYKIEIKDLRKLISQNADRKAIEKKLIDISVMAGSGYKSKYEETYVLGEEDLRNPYPMRGRIHEFPIHKFSRTFKNEAEYLKFAKNKRNKK